MTSMGCLTLGEVGLPGLSQHHSYFPAAYFHHFGCPSLSGTLGVEALSEFSGPYDPNAFGSGQWPVRHLVTELSLSRQSGREVLFVERPA